MNLKINTDGGARGNPGPAASGFIVKGEAGNVLEKCGKYIGETTNNQAEYKAVLFAMEWIKDNSSLQIQDLQVSFFLDSNLVVNQLNGKFKINDRGLMEQFTKIKLIEGQLKIPISYTYIPREQNFEADKIVNETLDHFTK